ncbi:MAG: hypothetical protein ACP5D5_04955 [Acidithiobacillus sp.]|uniref:hypothetical protein n=1 Tax=Acidithiobacillus sp. TaxID=1872118 RepID=UPI003D05C5FB
MEAEDALEYARHADLDRHFLEAIERLVMGQVSVGEPPAYAEDWEEAERLIARLADQGVGVRLEHVVDEHGGRWRCYLDWQDTVSLEWQMVDLEESTAARAVTRAALVWYYQQEVSSANAQPPDAWAYFEVLERLGMARDFLSRALEDHPVLAAEAELRSQYQEIQERFNALYDLANRLFDQRLESPRLGTMH